MKKLWIGAGVACALLVSFASLTLAQQKPQTWTGWVTDAHCPAKGAKAVHKDCSTSCGPGDAGAVVLWDRANKTHYYLDNLTLAKTHLGHEVKVIGHVVKVVGHAEGTAIKVESIERIR